MILAGNFNSRPNSQVMRLIDNHWPNVKKGPDRLTFSSTEPAKEIDFILYRPGTRFQVVSVHVLDEPVISDHRPLLMVLRLLPKPPGGV